MADDGKGKFERQHQFPSDETIHQVVEVLKGLERGARPGSKSPPKWPADWPKGKDGAAAHAIELASWLMRQMVGWAISHKVGLALSNVPEAPPAVGVPDPHPERLTSEHRASDDRYELIGQSYSFTGGSVDSSRARRALAVLLKLMAPAFPEGLALQAHYSLYALNLGTASGLFEPLTIGMKGQALHLELLRRKAVCHLEYRLGCGISRVKAKREIADAYGLNDESAIEKWSSRKRSKGMMRVAGLEDFLELRRQAREAGEFVKQTINRDSAPDPFEIEITERRERPFDESALSQDGRKFQQLTRKKNEKSSRGFGDE